MQLKLIKNSKFKIQNLWKLLICLGVIIGVGFAILKLTEKPANAAWFDDLYSYRQKITIGNSGAAVNNQKVKFDIDTATLITAGKMQSDCDDTRFTAANGQLLKYYLDAAGGACNDASTDYYVLYETINADNTDIFMYYGNPGAGIGTEPAQFSQSTFSPTSGPTLATEEKGAGPVAYLKFDEGVDNTCAGGSNDACNSTGNTANDGITENGPAWQPEEMCVSGKCMKFDGTNDDVTIINNKSIDLNDGLSNGFTFETWFKANSDGEADTGQIFEKASGVTYCRVDTESAGSVDVECNLDLATADANLNISAAVKTNTWNHLVLGFTDDSDDEITIWINGINRGTSSNGVGGKTSESSSITIAGGPTTNFHGFIDDFKIYNYERTAAQIKTDYVSRGTSKGAGAVLGTSADNNSAFSDGLAGYWKMDEASGNASDSSGNGNTLTDGSSTTYAAAKFANGADLELSSTDYLYVADNASLSITGALTVAAWIKPETTSGNQEIASKWDGANRSYSLRQVNDEIRFSIDSTNDFVDTNGYDLVAGTFYHIIGIYSPSRSMEIYINGVKPAQTLTGSAPASIGDDASRFHIGAIDSSTSTTNYYDGFIDDVRVYNRALSGSEVAALYNWAPGPVGYWKFDENTGTSTTYDSSGSGYDGTLTSITSSSWVPGKYGSALLLDGSADYITMASENGNFSINSYTFSAWIERSADTGGEEIIMDNRDGGSDGMFFNVGNSDQFACINGIDLSLSTTLLLVNTWYHVACTSDGTTQRLYVNGLLEDSDAAVDSISESTDFRVGARSYDAANPFPGTIDEVKVYNYARSSKQIVQDMNAGHPTGGSPVGSQVAYYKFDEQQGTSVNSSALTAFTETMTGTTWKVAGSSSCKINGCLDFDGSDDVITITNASGIDLNQGLVSGLTISSWIYADSDGEGDTGQIWQKGTNSFCRVDTESGGRVDVQCSLDLATTDATLNITAPITTGSWNHVAVVWTDDADDEISIYINGLLRGTSSNGSGAAAADSNNLLIGGTTTANFDGRIDEFKIYSSELSADEIKIDNNAGAAVAQISQLEYCPPGNSETNCAAGLNPAPVAEWKMDENTGTSLLDTAGNANTSSSWTSSPTWTTGKYGSALAFDGTVVHIPETSSTDIAATGTSFTVSAWIRFTGQISGTDEIVDKYSGSGAHPFRLNVGSSESFSTGINDGTNPSSAGTSVALNDGKWHNIAMVRDASTTRINAYVDGVLDAFATDATSDTRNNDDITLGGRADNSDAADFTGNIDNVRIYNYARTPAQIAWEWNRGGAIGWWKFDECTGITAFDSTSFGNNGTITYGSGGTHTSAGTCDSGSASEMWDDGGTGKRNYSLDFDGDASSTNADYVNFGDVALFNFGSTNGAHQIQGFSLAGWFNRETFTTDDTLIGKRASQGNGAQGYLVWIDDSTDKITFEVCDANATCDEYMTESTSTFTATGWNHFVVTWDPTSEAGTTMYINGVQENVTRTGTFANIGGNFGNVRNFRIGLQHDGNNAFAGELDDMMVFSYVINNQQVKTLYNDGAIKFGPATGSP